MNPLGFVVVLIGVLLLVVGIRGTYDRLFSAITGHTVKHYTPPAPTMPSLPSLPQLPGLPSFLSVPVQVPGQTTQQPGLIGMQSA